MARLVGHVLLCTVSGLVTDTLILFAGIAEVDALVMVTGGLVVPATKVKLVGLILRVA
jgi:hypothetical protein